LREKDLQPDDVALIGICSDSNSTFLRGSAEAPARIRAALHSGSANLTAESGREIGGNLRFVDLGDRAIGDNEQAFLGIESQIAAVVGAGARPLVLGGDHAITYPVVKAVAAKHGPLNLLHFDAHPDLYDAYEGNRYSHACPFARIMEAGLAQRLVQVGIRTLNAPQQAQARRFSVELHEMRTFDASAFAPVFSGPVYLSFDIDALDPAFAPGVSHHEPGGFSVREVLGIIQRLEGRLIGADIVEYNPRRDLNDMTAMVAAKLLKEIGAKMMG